MKTLEYKFLGDYDLLNTRPYSLHPDDTYLEVILVFNPDKQEYIVWDYNHNDDACFHGFYTRDKDQAEKVFNERHKSK